MINENKMYVESLVSLYMVEESVIKILLVHKNDEPYKGYWILPKDIMTKEENIHDTVVRILNDNVSFSDIYLSQGTIKTDVNRVVDNRVVAVPFLGITDPVTVSLKFKYSEEVEYKWFEINNLPKLAYDHLEVVTESIQKLRKDIPSPNVLKALYPSDFTLPELQKTFENILGVTLDRRNFRKRLLNMEWIVDSGHMSERRFGRPSKIYYFNEDMKEKGFFN